MNRFNSVKLNKIRINLSNQVIHLNWVNYMNRIIHSNWISDINYIKSIRWTVEIESGYKFPQTHCVLHQGFIDLTDVCVQFPLETGSEAGPGELRWR